MQHFNKLTLLLLLTSSLAFSQKKPSSEPKPVNEEVFSSLKFRSIGPAFFSGRIADIAVNPKNKSERFVAVASGHVWKTENAGTTWSPVFDNYGAYATSCIKFDPNNPFVLWLGTGENNHQRCLGYGNGVYKSVDGGASWTNVGLKTSRQIGAILIDPRNSDVVYVACEGSVWGPGGERGLYKTTDGGKTWATSLVISENTGVNNIICDPRNPDVLYASSEQRRRHIFTKIGGGPETAIYKSTDAGKNWSKLTKGLPSDHMGGMGLAISPINPDIIYAQIESTPDQSGFYRSENRGMSWEKMSGHVAQGQYYNEIFCDPIQVDKIYSVETWSSVTTDGGRTWKSVGNKNRHVDDHAIWIDPDDTKHMLIGSDGGLYESFDAGANFKYTTNLPVAQIYRVQCDNAKPFYNVYVGTQDNNSSGGPSRNLTEGVTSDEWTVTCGGDGFWTQIDPEDPNTVYSESQYGGMIRYNRITKESIDIRPEPAKGENSFKWNWNSPLIISAHNSKRLYVASNKVLRSDDRGDSWTAISEDLTAKIDRNSFPVMGKYWSFDAVQKDVSTSQFGTIISFEESTLKDGLLFAGTDDGVLSITEDGGKNWRQIKSFPGIPANTYISDIMASRFDENVVYVSFDNILRDDFKPYLLKSEDKGKTWTPLVSGFADNGTIHTMQQDHIDKNLLFAGTEFCVYVSKDGGKKWTKFSNGIPDVKITDLTIQRNENDLIAASFGRGVFILDNYAPLREDIGAFSKSDATIFPIKDALLYKRASNKDNQGSTYFEAPNPTFGATFTYYCKNEYKTIKDIRHAKEAELFKDGKAIPQPTVADLRKEESEIAPYFTFIIKDEKGSIVRRLTTNASKGLNQLSWDLRSSSQNRVDVSSFTSNSSNSGFLVMPGSYSVSLSVTYRDTTKVLAQAVPFKVVPLFKNELPAADIARLKQFTEKTADLIRVVDGTFDFIQVLYARTSSIKEALKASDKDATVAMQKADAILSVLADMNYRLYGKQLGASDEENPPLPVTLRQRLDKFAGITWGSISKPTGEQEKAFEILKTEFSILYKELKSVYDKEYVELMNQAAELKVPSIHGELPRYE